MVLPSKPLTSYIFYANEKIPELKLQDPNLKHLAAMKKSAELWGQLSEKDKSRFIKMQEKSKQTYLLIAYI